MRVFGKNVFASPEILRRVNDPNLSSADAGKIMEDYRQMFKYREQLRDRDLDSYERHRIQEQYDALLGQYFEVWE